MSAQPNDESNLPSHDHQHVHGGDCCADSTTAYHVQPSASYANRSVTVPYFQATSVATGGDAALLKQILESTPTPKGRSEFSSVHVVAPPAGVSSNADSVVASFETTAQELSKELVVHRLHEDVTNSVVSASQEYETIFDAASSLILAKADRASLVIFVGWEDTAKDALAAFIGMLPFRGVQTALVTLRTTHGNLLRFETESGVFEYDAHDAGRMGMFPIKAVFGPLASEDQTCKVKAWNPVDFDPEMYDGSMRLPFKIGGLELPMITHNGEYDDALAALAEAVANDYAEHGGFYPIVSCGETCDALGYGTDVLDALDENGFYFNHRSGETYKRYAEYGSPSLFRAIADAKRAALRPVIFAVGGGVNGNCIGLIAALTGADFIEVPTTPMHYNDATTSAKKAFSLVVDDVILSKNILGAFYLPRLVFCATEMLLTCSSANIHATVGESTKTMNMLGVANSAVGAADYHNILGASEFASDYTKILRTVGGFDRLIEFIQAPKTVQAKEAVIQLGKDITAMQTMAPSKGLQRVRRARDRTISTASTDSGAGRGFRPAVCDSSSSSGNSSGDDDNDQESDTVGGTGSSDDDSGTASPSVSATGVSIPARFAKLEAMKSTRRRMMDEFRTLFKTLPDETQASIKEFLTVVNQEIVAAKAMFLAYSDPFEKYRALLFEYAHTLGHGVEAFVNKLYTRCRLEGVEVPEEAFRLHGQCVGMAVLWAGQMSANLGVLEGQGLALHQSLVYLFNRHGGFSFGPLRALCDRMGVTQDEFCEGVLSVVRRDNKRGYCAGTDPTKSVDQLVASRPGKMLRSDDANAELRYLVEVDEAWQCDVLGKAFNGDFDRVADLRDGNLVFVPRTEACHTESSALGHHIHQSIAALYAQ